MARLNRAISDQPGGGSPRGSNDIRFSFPSGEFAVRTALATVLCGLRHLALSQEEYGTIELVLAEVLNNVVEHAYGPNETGRIEIIFVNAADHLKFSIIDEGVEMPSGETPMGKCADIDVPLEDMPEGGFGWFLIRDLTKDLTYRRVGSSNILSFRINIATQD
ncbi:MAG: ATP-binding protein [Rhodobacterales bacterium]|nr:ATP-binding protein [Rhodobacterales bacterium]